MNLRHAPATLLLLLAACAPSKQDASALPGATFTATDFAFDGPDTIAPGITAIRLLNHGQQQHHLILARLNQGKTLADLVAAFTADPNTDPPFVSWHGAAGGIAPGDSSGSIVELSQGHYAIMCFFADADGTMHFSKGMAKDLVVAGDPTTALAPATEGRIELVDFNYVAPELTAGTHTYEIINHGTQAHEVQLIRLDPGATAESFLASLAPAAAGPPPG
ncbi:MAG TPA: hypothetical protein VNH46_02290, partial [Gemmatimonadales bacterium]|nr:hypothetical protein [Gemmatimonadales bacterium]